MNQILDYSQNVNKTVNYGDEGKGKKYKEPKAPRGGGGNDTVVRVFAVMLIIFAIVLIAIGVVGKFSNNEAEQEQEQAANNEKAEIELIPNEDEGVLLVKVKHVRPIEKIIYVWENTKEKELKTSGEKEFETEISLPNGEQTITVKVIDNLGKETVVEKKFKSSSGVDIVYPQLDYKVEGNKLIIIATDETALEKVMYNWNDEPATEVYAESDNQKEIVVETDIERGLNDISITAVDKADNPVMIIRSFKGLTNPEVQYIVSSDNRTVTIRVTHEVGIQSIHVDFNGQGYDVEGIDGTQTDISVDLDVDPTMENVIGVKAVSVEGTENEKQETIEVRNENPPEIIVEQDGNIINVTFKSDVGLLKAELFMQGQTYDIGGLENNPKEASIPIELPQGTTRVVLTATAINGEEGVYDNDIVVE